jgi:hypothetical protein
MILVDWNRCGNLYQKLVLVYNSNTNISVFLQPPIEDIVCDDKSGESDSIPGLLETVTHTTHKDYKTNIFYIPI